MKYLLEQILGGIAFCALIALIILAAIITNPTYAQVTVTQLTVSCDRSRPVPVSDIATAKEIEAAKTDPKAAIDLFNKSPCDSPAWMTYKAKIEKRSSSSKASSSTASSAKSNSVSSASSSSASNIIGNQLVWTAPTTFKDGITKATIVQYRITRVTLVPALPTSVIPADPIREGEVVTIAAQEANGQWSDEVAFKK